MELGAEEVVAAEGSAEAIDVVARGDSIGTQLGVVGVYIIYIGSIVDVLEEGCAEVSDLIPSHVGNLFNGQLLLRGLMGLELSHLGAEDTHALRIALLAALTHELSAYADAQDGLCQCRDKGVESALCKLGHGSRGFAHTGEYHLVGLCQYGLVVGIYPVGAAHASQCVGHGAYVAGIVVDYSDHIV